VTQLAAAANYPLDTTQFNVEGLLTGTWSNRTSTGFQVDVGGGYIETYSGSSLTYDGNGNLSGGTLTGLEETYAGSVDFTMNGFSIDAVSYAHWVQSQDNDSATAALFGGDDTVLGSNFTDKLSGFGGNNVLLGGDGGDTLIGGLGNDHLYGQSPNGGTDGADSMSGGDGMDYMQGNAGNDTLDGGNGPDRINGGANEDKITAGSGNDSVNGNKGNDTIDGGSGDDTLRGGQDQDSISGGQGNDNLTGDLGDDTLIGGAGFDTLTGAAGVDRFQFSGTDANFTSQADVVTDYTDGTDKIALGFTVASVLTGAAQSSVSGAAAYAQQLFDNHSGNNEAAALQIGSDTYLFYSSSGGATVDSAIKVAAVAPGVFDTADFV